MTSEMPGQDAGPDQPQPDSAPAEPTPAVPAAPTPAWATPPPAAAPAPPPAWGAQPQQPGAPQQPPQGQWGAPPPATPAWNAAPPPQPGQGPGWGTPPAAPQQGWAPAPGTTPPSGWTPPPAQSSGNGCLRACLIVAIIGVVVVVVGMIALFAAGATFLSGFGLNPNGTLKPCPIVSTADLKTVLGGDVQASELTGLADATIGKALDRRVLESAPNCWVGSSAETTSAFGRIAKYSGSDAASVFQTAKSTAQSGDYFAVDVPGVGDEAFCTGWSAYPATGALVRQGDTLVYVSFIQGRGMGTDVTTADNGVSYSPSSCQDAVKIAELALK